MYYGPFWQHVKAAWAQRNNPNFFSLCYEKMKSHPKEEFSRLAKFLGLKFNDDHLDKVGIRLRFSDDHLDKVGTRLKFSDNHLDNLGIRLRFSDDHLDKVGIRLRFSDDHLDKIGTRLE